MHVCVFYRFNTVLCMVVKTLMQSGGYTSCVCITTDVPPQATTDKVNGGMFQCPLESSAEYPY